MNYNEANKTVLHMMRKYIANYGIGRVMAEIGTADTFIYKDINFGEWYRLLFPQQATKGIQPNNIGCWSAIHGVCWDLHYNRV
jgi:hypothetical protein